MNKIQKYLVIALTAVSPMLSSYNVVLANDKTVIVSQTNGKYTELELAHAQLVELIRTYNMDLSKAKDVQLALVAKVPALIEKLIQEKWLIDTSKDHAEQPHHTLQQSRTFLEESLTQKEITDYNRVFAYLAKLEQIISALKGSNTLAPFIKKYGVLYENSPNQQFKDVIRIMVIMANDTITLPLNLLHKTVTDIYLKSSVQITKSHQPRANKVKVSFHPELKLRNEDMLAKDFLSNMETIGKNLGLSHWQIEGNVNLDQYFAIYLTIDPQLFKKINTLPEADILPSLFSYYTDVAQTILSGAAAIEENVKGRFKVVEEIVEKVQAAVDSKTTAWYTTNKE